MNNKGTQVSNNESTSTDVMDKIASYILKVIALDQGKENPSCELQGKIVKLDT